ncbi:MAG TPA: ferrochelatase [Magnetospirillaceae bacterium]|jgi:ferrochelatase
MPRTAIVLFNLGGPDSLAAVRPFLFNLFSDKAIIRLPTPLRQMIAWIIAKRRDVVAQEIYERMGGSSPLLKETKAQAAALEQALGGDTKAFIAMRYWHPMTREAVAQVKDWRPERIVLLPLYPQFSTTTTASSVAAWKKEAARAGLVAKSAEIVEYPELLGMIAAQAQMIDAALAQAGEGARVLFSAHGLPKRIVTRGDRYPDQVMLTARAIAKLLAESYGRRDQDWRVCYQSRVGPVEWIGPYTDDEIRRAGAEKKPLVVVPIAFVSEHSETLVELDMDYKKVANDAGVPTYIRVPALGTHPAFIAGLAELVKDAFPYGN